MNLKNIYTTLCLSALAIVSCSKDKPMLTDKTEPGVPVAITVSDGGYDNDAVTRAVENGFVTEFTAGDACGLYVTQNGKVTSENIKLTLTQADGKLEWTLPQGTTLHFNSSDRYFLYYPYQETLQGTVDPNADDDAAFFADVISKWTPKADQSNYKDGYTASDLMTAAAPLSPVKNEDGRINLPFSMTHRMAMAVIEVPRTIYRFTNSENGGIPDYVTSADFGENKPYKTTSGSYRYIVPPSAQIVPTIIGSYADGVHKKKFRIIPAGIIENSYKTYNVNGAKVTQIEHQLQVGDFFLADGRVLSKDTDPSIVRVANVVGIVFQTDRNRIGAKEKEKLGGEGNAHGLVMSVKRTPANERWSAIYEKDGLKKCKTQADNYNDINGYGNCEHIRSKYGNFDNHPAFKAADEHNTACPVPASTTGWNLPSSGQWWDILQNLGGCPELADKNEQTSSKTGSAASSYVFVWRNQGDIPAALNKWMEAIPDGDKDTFGERGWYWSSSEYSESNAWGWYFRNTISNLIECTYQLYKDRQYCIIRPVLAF